MRSHRSLSLALVLTLLLVSILPVHADTGSAATWLIGQQRADGGFGLEQSTVSDTAEAVFALTAAGVALDEVAVEGLSPVDYLTANLESAATVGAQAKAALALAAAGVDVTDLTTGIAAAMDDQGQFGGPDASLTDSLYAVLALSAAGQEVPSAAVDWIVAHQAENGAWAWNGSLTQGDTDSNTSGVALQALLAAGVPADDPAVIAGLEYLRAIQNEDGGFPYQKPSEWGTDTDANSTAMALMAITAAGSDLAEWVAEGGFGPADALAALQNESGAFSWQAAMPDDNLFATSQALPALLGQYYPIATTVAAAEETQAQATAEPTAAATAEATAAPAATAAPVTVIPTTGGVVAATPWGQILMLAGAGLATGGYLVRRHLRRITNR